MDVAQANAEWVYAGCSLLCAWAGAVFDVTSRRIPNVFTFPAIIFGLLLHFSFGGWRQLGTAAAGGLLCGMIFLVFFIAGGMGGGDVKLIAAVGCTAGLAQIQSLLILTSLAGGVMALCLAIYRGRLKQTLMNLGALAAHHGTQGLAPHPEFHIGNAQTLRLPYALAIAAGSALSLWLMIAQR